jgi:hypothetical protein
VGRRKADPIEKSFYALGAVFSDWCFSYFGPNRATPPEHELTFASGGAKAICSLAIEHLKADSSQSSHWKELYIRTVGVITWFQTPETISSVVDLLERIKPLEDVEITFATLKALAADRESETSALKEMLKLPLNKFDLPTRDWGLILYLEDKVGDPDCSAEVGEIVNILTSSEIAYATKRAERDVKRLIARFRR